MSNIEELCKEFYSLEGKNVSEKRKCLNYYIKKIKTNIKSEDDLNLLTKSITPRNQLESSFKVEILLKLQRNDQLLDILKGTDIVSIAKIFKNWKFFSDVFSNMDCNTFFNNITPYISHSAMMKILTRLSKVLASEELADEYFNALRERYGSRLARMIMPACSIDLVKGAIQNYKMLLTSKELLIFTKKDQHFLKFYFSVLPTFNCRLNFSTKYKKVLQYIGRTDADLFWNLYHIYDFNNPNIEINLGESVIDFLFAQDETKTSNREVCVNMFKPRRVYNVLSKRGKMHILLANFCHGDESEFYRIYVENKDREFYSIQMFLDGMPKVNYFHYLNGAFKLKFGKDLLDYPKYFNRDILKTAPKAEKEKILDLIVKENDDLVYVYDINRSVPLLKEILNKNIENPDSYLKQLYRSCKLYPNEDALLEALKYIIEKFSDREHLLNEISMKIGRWPKSETFNPEIWRLIDEMLALLEYSDDCFTSSGFTSYLHKHIINSVDNAIPFDKLFRTLLNRQTDNFLEFEMYTGNVQYYYKEACKLMGDMRKKNDFFYEMGYLLTSIVEFNSKNKGNEISLIDYGHLLEMFAKRKLYGSYYGDDLITYGARYNVHKSFHNLYWKRFGQMYGRKKVDDLARNEPEIFLKNIILLDVETIDSLRETSFENFTDEMRKKLFDYCLDILTLNDKFGADKVAIALKLLSLLNEREFLNIIKGIDLTKLHEIHDPEGLIKQVLSKCLCSSSKVNNFLPTAIKVYKDTKFKNYLAPVHSYFHKLPLHQVKGIIKLFSENSIVRLRNLSVTFAAIFLTKSELYNWIREMNKTETDSSVKRHLYKKAFYLFLHNQNEANWSLLKDNIDLAGSDSRCALESWSKLTLISAEYCEKYVTHSFHALTKNGNLEWCKKKMLILIRPPAHGNLSFTFLRDLLEEISFYTTRTRNSKHGIVSCVAPDDDYYIEFLFHTSGEKQDNLLEFIFNKLKTYIDEKWSDCPDDEVFSNVYEFIRAFCKYTFKLRPKDGIVKKFHDKWNILFSASHFEFKLLMLEFLNLYYECECKVKEFSKESRELLQTFVERFGRCVLRIYCDELDYFRDAADIDRFSFLFGFIEGRSDPLTYSAVINMLPMRYSIPYTDEPKLEELKCILRNSNEPVVDLYFSAYYSRIY